ncbi:MAG: MBL fold metallo-hydrolase [Chitinophagaceae bacterium]
MNSALSITFLGTGTSTGVPMIGCTCPVCTSPHHKDKRLRSSILVQSATTSLVVDTGPDFRFQMLRAKIRHLDAILFTHPHKDHVAGMDDIRAFNYFSGMPMPLYANEMTQEVLIREFPYVFADTRYPGVPEVKLNTLGQEPFWIGDIPVQPIAVWHLRMPVLGFRFGNFTYITDANAIEPGEQEKIQGSQVLVLNALRKEKHLSHFTLDEAARMARQLSIPQTYLTHISHQLGLHEQIDQELPSGLNLAYDQLTITV